MTEVASTVVYQASIANGEVVETALREVRHYYDATGHAAPSAQVLTSVIDSVFWASLCNEEGRPVRPTVTIGDFDPPWRLATPGPLDTRTLVKIAPLFDQPGNGLWVDSSGRVVGCGPTRGMALRVTVDSHGRVSLTSFGRVIVLFEAGTWHVVKGDDLAVRDIVRSALGVKDLEEGLRRSAHLIEIVRYLRHARRGGTIVLVEPSETSGLDMSAGPWRFTSALDPFGEWSALVSSPDYTSEPFWNRDRLDPVRGRFEAVKAQLDLRLAVLGAGAGLDGVTVLEMPQLKLLALGVKIIASPIPAAPVAVLRLPSTTFDSTVSVSDLGGMRHQSAARLIQANHTAVAITVSQDGVVSLFAWAEKEAQVAVIRHLDRYLPGD